MGGGRGVRRWQHNGWVLIEGLVPTAEIDDAAEDLWRMFPRPEDHVGHQDRPSGRSIAERTGRVAPTRIVGVGTSRGRLQVVPLSPDEAPELYRAEVSAAGPRRPDGSRFVYNLSYEVAGQEWIAYDTAQPNSTLGRFKRFVEGRTPRELALFGMAEPRHPFWNAATLDAMSAR